MLIGQSPLRKEGREKVTGRARYIDDIVMDGMLHGVTVRSRIARGKITGIHFGEDFAWDDFTIVTAKDIPGKNYVALILYDQPFLADEQINHPEEPVVLLAHPDKHLLEQARRAVTITTEPLPAVHSIEDGVAANTVIWGTDNVFKRFEIKKGEVDPVFEQPGILIVEGDYSTGAQEQLYIEPNGVIARYDPHEGVTVWGSLQCPYYVHKALIPLFGLPEDKVRIIQAETGGGFGGKEEYPSMLSGHAALLAYKSGRPVKMIYDRAEDMVATTKRHPSKTHHRTAVSKDGRLLAMDIDFALDGGAYATLSQVVLSRGTIHASGPYRCDHVRVRSRAVATNTPPHGAFRGFGAPQSIFALERHMHKVAAACGLTPEAFRRKNFLHTGETTATSQTINEKLDLDGLLDRALAKADYHAKQKRFAAENAASSIKRGMGFATFMHGAGFTGSGERMLRSVVGVEATAQGKVRVLAASTEIGQGTNTIFSQIAADALGLRYDAVVVAQPDTSKVPNSGPTVASRTTMVVGKLVESAALGIKQSLAGLWSPNDGPDKFADACQKYIAANGELKCFSQYQQPPNVFWDDDKYQGEAYATYAWAVYVAEVSIDTATFETRVEDFVALQEIGRVVHPLFAAGQIEGGVAQGIGYAIYEKVVWKEGHMENGTMTNYIMPTAVDAPPIRVFFEETPTPHGPGGAKGIGELPIDGPAPAICNAITFALGRAADHIPLLPEDVMQVCA